MNIDDDRLAEAGLPDWRLRDGKLQARYATGSFLTGLELVNAIAEPAEAANHHPDLKLTYPSLDVELISHDVAAVTQRDLELATVISELAAARGIAATPLSE